LFEFDGAVEATVSTTPVDVYEMSNCSLELIAMAVLVKVPEILVAVRMVDVCPILGVKPLIWAAVSVPPRLAAPVEKLALLVRVRLLVLPLRFARSLVDPV